MVLPVIQGINPRVNKQTYTIQAPNKTPKKPIYLKNNSIPQNNNSNNQSIVTYKPYSLFQSKNLMASSLNNKRILGKTMPKMIKEPRVCTLCGIEVESYRYNNHINSHPSKIFDWLFLGSYRNASELKDLKNLNMTHILNCAIECRDNYPKNFTYCHLKLCDHPNFRISLYFNTAVAFLEEVRKSNGKVLVHCQMGISRSTTCIIAYMIKEMNYSAVEALKFIKRKRKIVFPNYGFMDQLIQYERTVRSNLVLLN